MVLTCGDLLGEKSIYTLSFFFFSLLLGRICLESFVCTYLFPGTTKLYIMALNTDNYTKE